MKIPLCPKIFIQWKISCWRTNCYKMDMKILMYDPHIKNIRFDYQFGKLRSNYTLPTISISTTYGKAIRKLFSIPLGDWTRGPIEKRAVSGVSTLEWVTNDVWRAGFTFPLSKPLKEPSRDSAAVLLGLDDFGDPKLPSRACLFEAEATSVISTCLLPEICALALFILLPSASKTSNQFHRVKKANF